MKISTHFHRAAPLRLGVLLTMVFALGVLPACAEEKPAAKEKKEAQADKPAPKQWYDLLDVGEEIFDQKKEILLTTEIALKIFQQDFPRFQNDWREKLNQPIEAAPDSRKISDKDYEISGGKSNREAFSKVVGFSSEFANVMILQPETDYRWHHYESCLANFKIPRHKETDTLFELEELERVYSFRYKGVGYGDGKGKIAKVLGRPDKVQLYGPVGLYRYYYLKDDVTIFVWQFVRTVTPGVSEEVKKEIAEHGSNLPPWFYPTQ